MEKDGKRVEALAVKNGKIMFAGLKSSALGKKGKNTKIIDLKGKCLMPGFFLILTHMLYCNLLNFQWQIYIKVASYYTNPLIKSI